MAKTISALGITLGMNVGSTVAGFSQVRQATTATIDGFKSASASLLQFTGAAAIATTALSAVRGVLGSLTDTLSLTSQLEQNQVAFETMTGSAGVAKKLMEQLNAFAASTPFQFPELASSAKKLLAFGVSVDQIIPTMKVLGDVAAGVGAPVGELAAAYGKVRSAGKLTAETLEMFNGRGIPMLATLAKQAGKSTAEITEMITRGQIGFPELQKALASLVGGSGAFTNMMEKQAGTLGGLWSTLTDNISLTMADLTATLINTFSVKSALSALIDATGRAGKILQSAVTSWAPTILSAGTSIVGVVGSIASTAFTAATSIVSTALPVIVNAFNALRPYGTAIGSALSGAFATVSRYATQAGSILWGIAQPIARTWTQTENIATTLRTVGAAALTAATAIAAWRGTLIGTRIATTAYTAALVAFNATHAAVTATIAGGQAVVSAYNVAVGLTASVVRGWSVVTAAAGIAQNAVNAAIAVGQVAYGALGGVLIATRIAGMGYVAFLAATAVWSPIVAAGQYVVAAATSALTATQWTATTAYAAVKGAVLAYIVACETLTGGQLVMAAVTKATAAAQWIASAAIAGTQIVVAAVTGALNAGSIAQAAWTAATSVATAGQWLLNAALAANPIGITVIAVAGLTAGLGYLVSKFVDFGAVLAWSKNAMNVAAYAIQNWQLSLKLAGVEAGLFAVRTGSQLAHVFTEVVPSVLTWFGRNWRQTFADVLTYTGTVFSNLLTNAVNFGAALWNAIKGNGLTFEWTPLTEGFKSALAEMPKIAERQVGPLESSLAKQAGDLSKQFSEGFRAYQNGDKSAAQAASDAATDINKAIADATKGMTPPELPSPETPKIDPFKIDASGATKALDDVSKKAKTTGASVQGLDAILTGSAESMKLAFAPASAAAKTLTPPSLSGLTGNGLINPNQQYGGNGTDLMDGGKFGNSLASMPQAAPLPSKDLERANITSDKNAITLVDQGNKQNLLLSDLVSTSKNKPVTKVVNY